MNQRVTIDAGHDLIELEPVAPAQGRQVGQGASRETSYFPWLFMLVFALPFALAVSYYAFVAAHQYASETRFLVRSPQRQATGLLSGFLQSTGFVRAQDDSFAVSEFIRSRASVEELERDGLVSQAYTRPEADILTRYPLFWAAPSREALFRHYLDFVTVNTDTASGVTTLQVRAFRPEDARRLAQTLVERAEMLINRLNDRARQDAVRHAQAEVAQSAQRLAAAQAGVTDFRNRETMVDPDKESTSVLELIGRLSLDVAEKRAKLIEIEAQAPRSPQVAALRGSIAATDDQIRRERERMVGLDGSIAPRIAAFEHLLLERELSTRMLASATASLENARLDAQRQQLYLERIVEPNLPDYATFPKALPALALLAAILLATYGILRILLLHIREHAEP